jgi:hypothetical protein
MDTRGRKIYTGSKGGQYVLDSKGKKIYRFERAPAGNLIKKFRNSFVKRSDAARKIQRAFKTWSKRNVITNDPIKSKRYALWNRSGKGHYNTYNLNTIKKLNINPFSRRNKDDKNIIYRRGLHKKIPFRIPSTSTPKYNNNTNILDYWNNDIVINSFLNRTMTFTNDEIRRSLRRNYGVTNENRIERLVRLIQQHS